MPSASTDTLNMATNGVPMVGEKTQALRGLYGAVALLAAGTIGTAWYLAVEEDPGWDGVFLYTALAFGWAFAAVGFNNLKRTVPNRGALWFSFGLYCLFGFGAFFGILAYWLIAYDEVYPLTFLTLVHAVATSAAMVYAIMAMTRSAPASMSEAASMLHGPGWHADPTGAHEQRFHDGERWTSRVRDGDMVGTDRL